MLRCPGISRFSTIWNKIVQYDFILLSFCLIFTNLPYFNPRVIPIVDTLFDFQYYYYFYSELYSHGHVGQWMPYVTYGLPAYLDQFRTITPMGYLSVFLGMIFRIKDVLFLFKLSLLLDQFVFLAGLYVLCRSIYKERSSTFMVCLAGIFTLVLHAAIGLNFRIFYMFPWTAYWLMLFYRSKRPEYFWFTGITALIWWLGSGPYFIILWFFIFFVMGCVLWINDKKIMQNLFQKTKNNLLLGLIFVAIVIVFLLYVKGAFDFTMITRSARDPKTGVNNLATFLSYGKKAQIDYLLQGFIFGQPTHLSQVGIGTDNNIYLGLIPFALFLWSLLKVRNAVYYSILAAALALLWLSFGGAFATVVYFFPAMAYFRHIGLVCSFAKIPILLCSGFGWESFWNSSGREKITRGLAILMLAVFSADMLHLPVSGQDYRWFIARLIGYFTAFAVVFGLNILSRSKTVFFSDIWRSRLSKSMILIALGFDLILYQTAVNHERVKLPPERSTALASVSINPIPFQSSRTMNPTNQRQQQAYDLMKAPGQPLLYAQVYNFTQFDACLPVVQGNDFTNLGVDRFLKARGRIDPAFLRVIGCGTSKIRFVGKAIVPKTLEEAKLMVTGIKDLDGIAIVRAPEHVTMPLIPQSAAQSVSADYKVLNFNANQLDLDVNVTSPGGGWLIYSDAYHPGWHATVNGKKVSIAEADLAFKAIWLDSGKSRVRFNFYYGFNTWVSYFLVLSGVVLGILLLVLVVKLLLGADFSIGLFRFKAIR